MHFWLFICILKKYFKIRGVILLNKAYASFIMVFILLIECFLQNIHIKGHWVNCDLINEENIKVFLSTVMYLWTLVSALNLILAFLVIFDRCVAKLSLLSKVIPNTFPHARLVWSLSWTPSNIKEHLSGLKTIKLL